MGLFGPSRPGEQRKARAALESLAALGAAARPAAAELLAYFREHASDEVLVQLAAIADPSFFDPLIRHVYARPRSDLGALSTAIAEFGATTSLSAETIAQAVKASGYDAKGGVHFGRSDQALAKLIADPAPGVGNLLHLVAGKTDVEVVLEYSCNFPSRWGTIPVEDQREKARRELARRGDPPYDADLYLRRRAAGPAR